MDLEQKLKEAEALVASVRKQIEEEKELKPFNWSNKARYVITGTGSVFSANGLADHRFYKKTKAQAKAFAHRLKILSVINNLKESLGCDWEFTNGEPNYYVYWSCYDQEWRKAHFGSTDSGSIHFKNKEDVKKVTAYLNKHYPNGWNL